MFNNNLASVKFTILLLVLIFLVNPGFTMSKRAHRHFKKANELYLKNNIINAEARYKKAEELSPEDPLIPLKMAEMYASIKNWDNAIQYYKKVIKLAPSDGKAYVNLGNILRTQQKYNEAYNAYQKAGMLLPNENYLYLYLGQVADLLEEDNIAIEHYKKFLSFHPDHFDARKDLAIIYLNNGKNTEALAEYETLIAKSSAYFYEWENYLKTLLLTKNYEKIFQLLDTVTEKMPNNAQIKVVAGTAYAETNQDQKAINEYLQALVLDNTLLRLNFDIGKSYEKLKQYDEAIKYYEIYLNKYPDSSETYYALSKVYEKKREFIKSINILNKLKEIDKEDVKVLKEIARNYYMSGDFKPAIEYYQEALKLSGDNAQIYFDIAQCYVLLKDTENAIANFQKSLQLDPNEKTKSEFAYFYFSIANEYKTTSDYQNALKYYKEAIALEENNTGFYLALADTLCDDKQNEQALDIYQKIIELDSRNFDANFNTSLIYFESGQYHQAKDLLSISAEINPDYAMIYYMLGVIFDKEKDYPNALNNYKKFIELEPENENATKIKKRISVIEQAKKR